MNSVQSNLFVHNGTYVSGQNSSCSMNSAQPLPQVEEPPTSQSKASDMTDEQVDSSGEGKKQAKIPPDLIASTLGEELPMTRTHHLYTGSGEHYEQTRLNGRAIEVPSVKDPPSASVHEARNDKESECLHQTSHGYPLEDQSECRARVDAVLESLFGKMLLLRNKSSSALSNLEYTMQLLSQVKASTEDNNRHQKDWSKSDVYGELAKPASGLHPGSHMSPDSVTVADNPDCLMEQYLPSGGSHDSQSTEPAQPERTPNPARAKSQQWDLDTFAKYAPVERSLTTSQSTYEVSRHAEAPIKPYTTLTPGAQTPSGPIPQESGFASSSSVHKPTRRSALHLATALFRTSSRDRKLNDKTSSSNSSSASGPGRYFKRRSKSKDQTKHKAGAMNSMSTANMPSGQPILSNR